MPDHFIISKRKTTPEQAKALLTRFTELLEKWNGYAGKELTEKHLKELRVIGDEAKYIARNYTSIFPEDYTYEAYNYDIPIGFPV